MVALKFKGTSIALWCCAGKLSSPHLSLLGYRVYLLPYLEQPGDCTAATAENGGGVNSENNPCCNVMNQEAGILHQPFMQIFGCSLSWRTWKEWVLKTHCRVLINPISPQERSICLPPCLISLRYIYNIVLDILFLVRVHVLLCFKNTKKGTSLLDFKQHKKSTFYN